MESDATQRQYYSVQFRLQRVTTEYCYINVPVTSDLMISQPDGTGRLNVESMVNRAVEISQFPDVKWYIEDHTTSPHPVQKPMEPSEERFQGLFPHEK